MASGAIRIAQGLTPRVKHGPHTLDSCDSNGHVIPRGDRTNRFYKVTFVEGTRAAATDGFDPIGGT
jgi:hypothetical protein